MEKQFKQFTAEKQGDFWCIASDETVDRSGDVVKADGWELDNFKKNPVLLWAHDYWTPPVGKANDIQVSGGKLIFKPEFAPTQLGQEIKQLYEGGYLKTFSVGFIPKEFQINPDTNGYIYTKSELLEISCVPVPANPNALALLSAKGLLKGGENVVIKGAIPYKQTPKAPEDEAWDAGEEVKKATVDDLKIMCAWYDDQNPDVKQSYKLPHHKADGDHAVVWNGVRAAMAALLGARGGVDIPDADKEAVYNHLAKHYKEFDKEPPEFHKEVDLNMTINKEGRTLSSANVEKLSKIASKIDEAVDELMTFIQETTGVKPDDPDEEEGGKSMDEKEIREKLEQEYKQKLESEIAKMKEEFKTALKDAVKEYKEIFTKTLKGDEK